ncbi:MAG: bacteriochlorophyll 4-vinyl reductase [Alsobacter sp.]
MVAITAGRVGPNAITRIAEALSELDGRDLCRRVFSVAGLTHHLEAPPTAMVDENDVSALNVALYECLGMRRAEAVASEAGRLTGEYLLCNRIPAAAQAVLRSLPRPLAARLLVRAIAKHAWTFAGSGTFSYAFDDGLKLRLERSPVCRHMQHHEPSCHYLTATFQRIFSAILGGGVAVEEVACSGSGAPRCVFAVSW